ncbi:MAG: hypothetical protein PGN09_01215 [Sphingomonas fennica]
MFEASRRDAMADIDPTDEGGPPGPRDAFDAEDRPALKTNPADEDAKLDIALDETFPTSDAPSNTQPGKGSDPAPSSGFDEEAEAARAEQER